MSREIRLSKREAIALRNALESLTTLAARESWIDEYPAGAIQELAPEAMRRRYPEGMRIPDDNDLTEVEARNLLDRLEKEASS